MAEQTAQIFRKSMQIRSTSLTSQTTHISEAPATSKTAEMTKASASEKSTSSNEGTVSELPVLSPDGESTAETSESSSLPIVVAVICGVVVLAGTAVFPKKFVRKYKDEDGNEVEKEIKYTDFRAISVFDISQTEAEDIPTLCSSRHARRMIPLRKQACPCSSLP